MFSLIKYNLLVSTSSVYVILSKEHYYTKMHIDIIIFQTTNLMFGQVIIIEMLTTNE